MNEIIERVRERESSCKLLTNWLLRHVYRTVHTDLHVLSDSLFLILTSVTAHILHSNA